MGTVKMLSLYRCSGIDDVAENMIERDMNYYVTDYFDGIKIDNLDIKTVKFAECMGIKGAANTKNGISHQRYCLYTEDDEKDIFNTDKQLPILTVVQVFINPDMHQVDSLENETYKMNCAFCMRKVNELLADKMKERTKVDWQIYRLLTSGDFAIIIRSESVRTAYEFSSLVRSISLRIENSADKSVNEREPVFFTYSISGVMELNKSESESTYEVDWTSYLNDNDVVLLRGIFPHRESIKKADDNQNEIQSKKKKFMQLTSRLLGRYDFQIELSREEFAELYNDIKLYKFGGVHPIRTHEKCTEKAMLMSWMLANNYISGLNEKIVLNYDEDDNILASSIEWKVKVTEGTWIKLYDDNKKRIQEIKRVIATIESELQIDAYYRARNMKDYVRLLGRFCRILNELNQMQELRISTANLLKQLEVFVYSLQGYIEELQRIKLIKGCDIKGQFIDQIENSLRMGISALQIFTRYIRNINLQTLQTPNYDIQTNVCIEKILLAYSQFLQLFTQPLPYKITSDNVTMNRQPPYTSSQILYPIVVPNMNERDMSVGVIFHRDFANNVALEVDKVASKKLMVVYCPTFSYLCNTCFMIPAIFHEIAHQFRYESQKERNNCLQEHILKGFIAYIIEEIMDKNARHELMYDSGIRVVVDNVYKRLQHNLGLNLELGLLPFQHELIIKLQELVNEAKPINSFAEGIKQYVKYTKDYILDYDESMLKKVKGIIQVVDDEHSDLEKLVRKYAKELNEQYCREIKKILSEEERKHLENVVGTKELHIEEMQLIFGCLEQICSQHVGDIGEDKKLCMLLHQWKVVVEKFYFYVHCDNNIQADSNSDIQNCFNGMIGEIISELLSFLKNYDKKQKALGINGYLSIDQKDLSLLQRKLQSKETNDIKKKIYSIFKNNNMITSSKLISQYVESRIESYREITSDIFMCSILGLDVMGYLVVVAENFVFAEKNRIKIFQRISIVLQCLSQTEEQEVDKFSYYLLNKIREHVTILRQKSKPFYPKATERDDFSDASYEEMLLFLQSLEHRANEFLDKTYDDMKVDKLDKENAQTSYWIIRIYQKIVTIASCIHGIKSLKDEFGGEVVWNDLLSDKSYFSKREDLQQVLKENGSSELCQNIAMILNELSSYYGNPKSLVEDEIQFILNQYEDNCKSVFRKEKV